MKIFLKDYADRIESKDFWQLLNDLRQVEDGTTVNRIYAKEWLEAVQEVRKGKKSALEFQK